MISPLLQYSLADVVPQVPLEDLMIGFPEEMKNKALRYRMKEDAYRYVLGRKLLKKAAPDFGCSPEKILHELTYSNEGKPLHPELCFSISHSGDIVACIVSDEGPVGLDVEEIKTIEKPEYFRQWFSADEWLDIEGADSPELSLYTHWTKKEALLKAAGCGLGGLKKIVFLGNNQYQIEGKEKVWTVKSVELSAKNPAVGHWCH